MSGGAKVTPEMPLAFEDMMFDDDEELAIAFMHFMARVPRIDTEKGHGRFKDLCRSVAPVPLDTANQRAALSLMGELNDLAELMTFLVRTGKLRDRGYRLELAKCCLAAMYLLGDSSLPDELWERWLDRRDLEAQERLRQLWLVSAAKDAYKRDVETWSQPEAE